MSKLSEALGNMSTPGMSRLRGASGGQLNYQQATVGVDPSYGEKSKLIGTVGKMAEMGANAYMQYDQKQQDKADERSNEIIRKLTPEQRREAIQNGTLLYKDDPYAMKALKEKTGRNGAFLVDDDVNQKVQAGQFRTRQEMETYRHEQLTKQAKEFANTFGIDEFDEDYQRGFNSDITSRNIQLYGSHDNFLSEQAKKGNVLNSRIELQGALNDPEVLRSPNSGTFFESYISNNLKNGVIPSDTQALQIIQSSINDVTQRDGGANFLSQIENRKVTLHGTTSTYRELMGDEQWNAMMVSASNAQFQNDAKRNETFRLGLSSATLQDDPHKGWEMLQGMKDDLSKIQPGEQTTKQREMLMAAEENLQERFKQQSAQTAKAMDDQKKTSNKSAVFDEQFQKRINGQYVSTAYADMPTNENTGEFKHSDAVNYANSKLAEIDRMDISEPSKDREKLKYLQADSKEGPFRTAIGTMVTDAQGEWNAAVINGQLPDDTAAMDNLRRLRNANPELIASLYPEQVELFQTMDMMDKYGIKPQVIIEADKLRASRSKEQQFEDDKAFESALKDSAVPEISRIPANMRDMARKVYDSWKYRTGNENGAAEQMSKFLKESTTTFTSADADGKVFGVLSRSGLQVTDDPHSWEQGRDIIQSAVQAHIKQNPWVTNQQMSVFEQGGRIYVGDTTGNFRVTYDKDLLQKEYANTQRRAQEAAAKKAFEEANKRAPISAVNQVASEIRTGKRKGLAQRSQEFRDARLNRKQ